jgi:hypothetical protein
MSHIVSLYEGYREKESNWLNGLFYEFDSDGEGYLTSSQLCNLVRRVDPTAVDAQVIQVQCVALASLESAPVMNLEIFTKFAYFYHLGGVNM